MSRKPALRIKVRCIGCKAVKVVGPEQRGLPSCDRCFMPMITESSSS